MSDFPGKAGDATVANGKASVAGAEADAATASANQAERSGEEQAREAKIRDLAVVETLPDVSFGKSNERTRALARLLSRILQEDVCTELGIEISSQPDKPNKDDLVDLVQQDQEPRRFGFAFGVRKTASGFRRMVTMFEFEYRHEDVLNALRRFLVEAKCADPCITYERANGLFIYHVFP